MKKVKLNKPTIPYISNLSGKWISEQEVMDTRYWVQHLREAVRFNDGIKELLKKENTVFIEVGPGRTLGTFVTQNPMTRRGHQITNIVRHVREDISDDYYLLDKIGRLWVMGADIRCAELYNGEKRKRISLPTYPFKREYY